MFFRKREKVKKRVICPIPVILGLMQECVDIDAGSSEFIILFEGKEHKVGFNSDYDRQQGFFDPVFYLDEQTFSTLEEFKTRATLNGLLFASRTDNVEILDADNSATKFPWYTALTNYIVD